VDRHSCAIVLGAGMSGLLAVRALSRHFERVTLVECDVLGAGEELRKGVPQAAHVHGLLASGYRVMDERRRRRRSLVPVRSLEAAPPIWASAASR
jgi:glycine/D-amino acid oxidase-like deaminating enzyme